MYAFFLGRDLAVVGPGGGEGVGGREGRNRGAASREIRSRMVSMQRGGTEGSYPVPPEVGKIGTNSPTYIQPVSERADGIKSFFQKQSPSKPKPKTMAPPASSVKAKQEEKDEKDQKPVASSSQDRAKQEVKSETRPKDEEKDLGDDSNAPNPVKANDEKPSVKRKRSEEDNQEKAEDQGIRKGGHQTKIVRKNTEEGNKESPSKKAPPPPPSRAATISRKKGKK